MKILNYKYIITLLLAGCSVMTELYAQQVPLYSQYYFNKFIYNPAFAGDMQKTEAYLIGRRQWDGVAGYQTNVLTVNGTPWKTNVGLGLHLINDKNSIVTTNSLYGSYAYRIKMSDRSMLALGMAIGMMDRRFNVEDIIVSDYTDPIIPLLSQQSGPVFDANFGINLKISGFQLGLSAPQAFTERQSYKDNYNRSVRYINTPHFIATASYDIWLTKDKVLLQPLVMYKSTENAPSQIDANLMLDWLGKGWVSVAYRDQYAMTFSGGLQLGNVLRAGYSYDYSIHEQSAALGATHELMLGISLERSRKDDIDEEKVKADKAEKARQAARDSMRDDRITELEDELDEMKRKGGIKDTVVIVQKVETVVRETADKPKDQAGTRTESGVSETGNFMIVAGSFKEEKYAKGYVARLKNMGQPASIYKDPKSGTYYVHLGRYDDKGEAKKAIKNNTNKQLSLWVKTLE